MKVKNENGESVAGQHRIVGQTVNLSGEKNKWVAQKKQRIKVVETERRGIGNRV